MKQETIEEAAERNVFYGETNEYISFMDGAKWQQEKSYSEKEVLKLLKDYNQHTLKLQALKLGNSFNVDEWFKQFKKK